MRLRFKLSSIFFVVMKKMAHCRRPNSMPPRFLLRVERGEGEMARGVTLLEKAKGKQTRAVDKKKLKSES